MIQDPIAIRPTYINIDLEALAHNLKLIKQHVLGNKVLGVVKANGYGHGLVECAQKLQESAVDFLGVAFIEEALELRNKGISVPILVMSGLNNEQIKYFIEYDIDILASSVSKLEAIEQVAGLMKKKARVHLEIDTGIERVGVHYYNSESLFTKVLDCKNSEIVGVSSHFAKQDSSDLSFTKLQLERFLESVAFFEKHSLPLPLRHIAASGATLQLPESHLDMVRPGVALYGAVGGEHLKGLLPLKPVMGLSSRVVYFKVVKKGNGVSYDHIWTADEDTRVATVSIGYGDGFPKRLSNKGQVIIRGKKYPMIGKICMDQMMVSLGAGGEAYNGDEVMLIGKQGEEEIAVEEIAKILECDVREVFVQLNLRIPRHYS